MESLEISVCKKIIIKLLENRHKNRRSNDRLGLKLIFPIFYNFLAEKPFIWETFRKFEPQSKRDYESCI